MRLTGEDELHRTVRIVDYLIEAVQVAEQQMRPLVGGESAGKAYGQHIGAESVQDGHYLMRRVVAGYVRIGYPLLDHLYHPGTKFVSHVPDHTVVYIVDALEALLVVLVGSELGTEHLGVNLLPLRRGPCGIMHSVGHIAYVQLLRQITGPQTAQNLLADLAVHPAHAVDLL